MTKYNVHLFREMRLYFPDIEAESSAEAAGIASDTDSCEAEDIEDCSGEDLGAMVDVAGDEHFTNSDMIDFDAQKERKAAAAMLAVLKDASTWIDAQLFVQRTEIQEKIRQVIASVTGAAP